MHSLAHPTLDEPVHRPDKLAVLVQALADAGVPPAEVLRGSGLDPAALRLPDTRVTVRQLLAVHERARRLAPEPGLALRTGTRIRITHFGLYGYALLASPTPREAIDFALKYRALASPLIGLDFRLDGDEAVWCFDDVLGLGRDSALLRFVFELQLGTQLALHRDLLGPALVPRRAAACYAAPENAAHYREVLGCPVAFGQPRCELRFDAAWLDHPLAFGNPITAEVARQTCDQLLAQMRQGPWADLPGATAAAPGATGAEQPLSARLAQRLLREPGQFPGIEAVAAELAITSRTLRRRLQAEGRSYQQVLDEVRCRLAQDYLRSTRMSTEDIAAALGFSEAANFRHAFKRWTGRSPGAYRAEGAS